MNSKKQCGFTLVELLVVISIVSLISSVVYANLNDARIKAQDTKKVTETQQVQKAIGFYRDDHAGSAPGVIGSVYKESDNNGGIDTPLQTLVDGGYLSAVPDSPDDTYVYINTGTKAILQTSLKKGSGISIPTTCEASILYPRVSSRSGGLRISFTAVEEYSAPGKYEGTSYFFNGFDPEIPGWTVADYHPVSCNGGFCYSPAASWAYGYNAETGECVDITGNYDESTEAGSTVSGSICSHLTDMALFAYELSRVSDVIALCSDASAYCSCSSQ